MHKKNHVKENDLRNLSEIMGFSFRVLHAKHDKIYISGKQIISHIIKKMQTFTIFFTEEFYV